MGTIGISGRIKDFLNKYKLYLADNDISGLLGRGKGELKPFSYNELLLVLHNANINLNNSLIFEPECDLIKVLWADNNDILLDFYNNSPIINVNIPALQYIEGSELLDALVDLKSNNYYPISLFSQLRKRNVKLNSTVKIYLYMDDETSILKTQMLITDNRGGQIHIVHADLVGRFYDGVGYAWDSKRFKEQADYLIELIKNIEY